MKKIKYSVDASGRLVIKPAGKKTQTADGVFSVDKNNQLIYRLNAPLSWRREYGFTDKIIFNGSWQINTANRLVYILSRSSNSCFDFRAQAESANLYPQAGRIKYRLGIGLKGQSPQGTVPTKIISLYGTWKFQNNQGKSLGIILTLTHKFLKGQGLSGSEAFLRFKANRQEKAVEAGARVLF